MIGNRMYLAFSICYRLLHPCWLKLVTDIICYFVVNYTQEQWKLEILKIPNLSMVKIVEMDERISLEKQLDEDVGPIIMMNKLDVDPQELDEFL